MNERYKESCLLIQQHNFLLLLAPRSGLAAKHFIDVGGKFGVSLTFSLCLVRTHSL